MKPLYTALFTMGLMVSTSPVMAQDKTAPITADTLLSAEQIQRDINLAEEAFTRVHPGYDRFIDKRELDAAWEAIRQRGDEGLTLGQLYLDVSETLAKIRCDHTKAELPKALQTARKTQAVYLPFAWDMVGERAIVTAAGSADNIMDGDEVLSIDGRDIKTLQAALHKYIPVDGFNDHTKNTVMTDSLEHMGGAVDHFGAFIFTPPATAKVKIKKLNGEVQTVSVNRVGHTARRKSLPNTSARNFSNAVTFKTLGTQAGYLKIDTFVNYRNPIDPAEKLDPIFKQLKEEGRDTLILDLRQNGGGSTDVSLQLFSYFTPEKRSIRKAAVMKTRNHKGLEPYINTWEKRVINPSRFGFKATEYGQYSVRPMFMDDLKKTKPSKYKFDGELIILTSRNNSSGSTNFMTNVKAARPVTLVGEKTGGNPEGPTAGTLFFFKLPESGITLRLPIIRFYNNTDDIKVGHGLTPDISAVTTIEDIQAGRDVAYEKAISLIQTKME
jgi:C-terminal processing protease CtpA/Prc